MRVDCALLCDAATVREGLLHILGGGVTRLSRPEYPSPFGVSLALRIMVHSTEIGKEHALEVLLLAEDGENIAAVSAGFQIDDPGDLAPGEEAPVALPITFPPQAILPRSGGYSFEILIDGVHQSSVPFRASQVTAEA